jgi:hypothetical protein
MQAVGAHLETTRKITFIRKTPYFLRHNLLLFHLHRQNKEP